MRELAQAASGGAISPKSTIAFVRGTMRKSRLAKLAARRDRRVSKISKWWGGFRAEILPVSGEVINVQGEIRNLPDDVLNRLSRTRSRRVSTISKTADGFSRAEILHVPCEIINVTCEIRNRGLDSIQGVRLWSFAFLRHALPPAFFSRARPPKQLA